MYSSEGCDRVPSARFTRRTSLTQIQPDDRRSETDTVPHATHSIDDLLAVMVEHDASDLHLTAGSPPVIRVRGRLERLSDHETADARRDPDAHVPDPLDRAAEDSRDAPADRLLALDSRPRALPRQRLLSARGRRRRLPAHPGARSRLSRSSACPTRLYELADKPRGLVLVTGPTGSGKSTTLASLLDHINRTRHEHILTIEDPIEFLHHHRHVHRQPARDRPRRDVVRRGHFAPRCARTPT